MRNLNNEKQIKKLDKKDILGSINSLSQQCAEAWEDSRKVKIPSSYKNIQNIVISGMGGSSLGGDIIQNLFKDELKVPITIVRDYSLPDFVNSKTLLILSSYSGTTEETLAVGLLGKKRKAKILGITTGRSLGNFLKKNKLPGYIFDPKSNVSGEPRMGLGYSIVGQIGLLSKCGILKVSDKQIKDVVKTIEKFSLEFDVEKNNNVAKDFAKKLVNKIPLLVGSEFLSGNVHAFANQINENAKCFADYFISPELNHHLMEGLTNPGSNRKNLKFFLVSSDLYYKKNQKRYEVLKDILKGNRISFLEYKPKSKDRFLQSFEVLVLGSYVSFYLAMLYGIDPSAIPWVDLFKKKLK